MSPKQLQHKQLDHDFAITIKVNGADISSEFPVGTKELLQAGIVR